MSSPRFQGVRSGWEPAVSDREAEADVAQRALTQRSRQNPCQLIMVIVHLGGLFAFAWPQDPTCILNEPPLVGDRRGDPAAKHDRVAPGVPQQAGQGL